jgi:WD40 repeat protein
LRSLAISADGRVALSGGDDDTARLWDIRTGEEICCLPHPTRVWDVALTPDLRFGLTTTQGLPNQSGSLRVWNLAACRQWAGRVRHNGAVTAVALSPDGKQILSGNTDGTVLLWNLGDGAGLAFDRDFSQQPGRVHEHGIAFFPDGSRVATVGEDELVHVWQFPSGVPAATWNGHTDDIVDVAISSDGRHLLTGSLDDTVRLWDTATGTHQVQAMPSGDEARSVAFLPDGRVLAAGDRGPLALWDASFRGPPRMIDGPAVKHLKILVHPDGQHIFTADHDGDVRVWDVPPP